MSGMMCCSPFKVLNPETLTSCVVFASPHSGRNYSDSFLAQTVLNEVTIRSSEDAFVDRLFDFAPVCGAPLISANMPRAYIDLNRSPADLDPAVIAGIVRSRYNHRGLAGLGVVPRVVSNGQAIYAAKLDRVDVEQRIATYWRPYHEALKDLLNQAHRAFGTAVLVDCHSMPHEAMDGFDTHFGLPADVVIGDRFGKSASNHIVDRIQAAFLSVGFRVQRNAPFAGAYILQAYGKPVYRRHAVQIEIDRSLYMNEKRIEPNSDFDAVRRALRQVIAEIVQVRSHAITIAAE